MISRKVTLLIICVSIIEIFFTIRIASLIGAGITIILFILTGTIGIKIMRHNTVNINNNIKLYYYIYTCQNQKQSRMI